MRALLITPCTNDEFYGGVQLTARLAIEGLSSGSEPGQFRILCYGPKCNGGVGAENRFCSASKPGMAIKSLRLRGWAERQIFWHLDLLKLIPFLGHGARPKYLFLHGVECWRFIEGAAARLVDQVDVFLTNSDFTWKQFCEINPRWRNATHRTVQLGVGEPEAGICQPGPTPAAVIIGRMNAAEGYKGHRELIEAWPLVLKSVPDAELWIVGGGDGEARLKALASAGPAARRIRFFGVVPDERKQDLLRQSRCLVLPSRGEGFGLVYLEAMRLGRPCLSSTLDAGQEVIGHLDAGIAVDPRNPCGLAEAVVNLLDSEEQWQRWSANAARRYESGFTAAHFRKRLAEAVFQSPA